MSRTSQRIAFTLIELLVVIAIIAILVGLTAVVAILLLAKGPEVRTVNEIRQLEVALAGFKAKFGFYPPDRVRLCRYRGLYNATAYNVESLSYINAMWPDIDWGVPGNEVAHNWDGLIDAAANPPVWDLEGDQCLVFFLGGIPGPGNTVTGFSTSKTNPTTPGGDRLSFFEFESKRLYSRIISTANHYNSWIPFASYDAYYSNISGAPSGAAPNPIANPTPVPPTIPPPAPGANPIGQNANRPWPFSSYKDIYSDDNFIAPYVYFTSGKRTDGYRQPSNGQFPANERILGLDSISAYYQTIDTSTNPPNITKFQNPSTFQIIGPGADHRHGPGLLWMPAFAELHKGNPTGDNMTNFHPTKLEQ